MPQPLPDRPDFFTRHRALLEQAVAATVARGRGAPCPQSSGTSAYAGHAALSDPAFVTGRFATPRSRRPVPFEESAHV
jgi:hypothetical protein